MPLHPQAQQFLAALAEQHAPGWNEMTYFSGAFDVGRQAVSDLAQAIESHFEGHFERRGRE